MPDARLQADRHTDRLELEINQHAELTVAHAALLVDRNRLRRRCAELETGHASGPHDGGYARLRVAPKPQPCQPGHLLLEDQLSPALLDCAQKARPKPPAGRRQPLRRRNAPGTDEKAGDNSFDNSFANGHGGHDNHNAPQPSRTRPDSLTDLQVFRKRIEFEMMHKSGSAPRGLGSENRRPGNENNASPPTKNWSKHALARSTERGVPVRRLGSIRAMPAEHKGGALLHKDPDINATYLCREDTVVTVYR